MIKMWNTRKQYDKELVQSRHLRRIRREKWFNIGSIAPYGPDTLLSCYLQMPAPILGTSGHWRGCWQNETVSHVLPPKILTNEAIPIYTFTIICHSFCRRESIYRWNGITFGLVLNINKQTISRVFYSWNKSITNDFKDVFLFNHIIQ